MVPRLGLSSRQSQANRGLVMAMCIGDLLGVWVRPPVYTADDPRTRGGVVEKSKKISGGEPHAIAEENEPLCGEGLFRPSSNCLPFNELPHSASGSSCGVSH